MLTVKRELDVAVGQPQVWQFVREMSNWASQMPGYLSHEQVNADDSVWTMQMNLGPFTRPIVMDVHVSEWIEPSAVNFTVKGRFDPFQGKGSFVSQPAGAGTRIVLDFDVEGTGSMAKVISAMAAPVLTTVADQFTANLKTALGGQGIAPPPVAVEQAARPGLWRRLLAWLGVSNKAAP